MTGVSAMDATRTLYALNNLDEWPLWPMLPVQQADPEMRRRPDGLGFMVAVESRRWHVYLGNIWTLRPGTSMREQLDAMDKLTYNGPEAIVSDGWIVD